MIFYVCAVHVLGLTSVLSQYQPSPSMTYYYQPGGLSRPIVHPELGMSPQYHNLVYNYVNSMAGSQQPQQVHVEAINLTPQKPQGVDYRGPEYDKEETTEGPLKPGLQEHSLPSDFLFLSNHPQSQFFGNFDAINMKKMKFRTNKQTLPPLGGVISNYVLLRDYPNYQTFMPFAKVNKEAMVTKRQAYDNFNTDDVVITNDDSEQAGKKKEGKPEDDKEENDKDELPELQPAVAQSKPSAIALAGPGGVAQASPVGTALVGPGGLAVSAPSGTAVAGPAGQGAIIANPDEKMKSLPEKKRKESTDE